MELTDADLCKRSEKLESQELQRYTFSPAHISALETLLLDVYTILRPTKVDYVHRRNLVHEFDSMAKENYGQSGNFPIVEAFGSFIMDVFTAKSDLDLSLNFSADETASFPREKKIFILRKLAKILYAHQRKGKVSGVLPILRARVPVLKVVHRVTGIECDISVENKDGISRSLIINLICLVDERFRILSFLMKVWAKAHEINSTKDHTLSSLSIILLVAFHLQTRDPPILPPFSALLRDGRHPVNVEKIVHEFKDFGGANKESVAELFISLLSKLSSVRSLWEIGLCASTYEGCWISKPWKTANIGVEDFLDQSQNCARAVGKVELSKIYGCIDSSVSQLVQFTNGQVEVSDLRVLLFGPASLHTRDEDILFSGSNIPKKQKQKKKRKIPPNDPVADPDISKKTHYTQDEDKKQNKKGKLPSSDSVAAPDNSKKIHYTQDESKKQNIKRKVPSNNSVAVPDNTESKKQSIKIKVPSNNSVAVPDNTKRIHYTGRSDQLRSQIPSSATVYPKQFVPSYHQPIPRQLSFGIQDHLKLPPECYNLHYLNPQQPLLSLALASYPHLLGAPFNAYQSGCGSHVSPPFVAPSLAYGPEHYPHRPFAPAGMPSGHQTQPSLISRELHYRPLHDIRSPLSQFSHTNFGLQNSINPMPSGDGHQAVHFGYHDQIPTQPFHSFYRG